MLCFCCFFTAVYVGDIKTVVYTVIVGGSISYMFMQFFLQICAYVLCLLSVQCNETVLRYTVLISGESEVRSAGMCP